MPNPPSPSTDETSASHEHPQQTETDPMPSTTHQLRNAEVTFRGTIRSNATHVSVTEPDARL